MISVFVPGRLCLLGEHSDWAAEYRYKNEQIEKGYAITVGLKEGVFLEAEESSFFVYIYGDETLKLTREELVGYQEKDFFEYVVSCAKIMLTKYNVFGIKIVCREMTLPIKKGLASSAAICTGIIKAYNGIFDLRLTRAEEMKLAYEAEQATGSRCGRLDQICAYGIGLRKIEFDKNLLHVEDIRCKGKWHFLVVDLEGSKDTKKILSDLNSHYPYPKNEEEKRLYTTLGKYNKSIINKACNCFENGKKTDLGKLMKDYQDEFDNNVAIFSDELKAPLLHGLFRTVSKIDGVLGYKGVGSQGDGMAQILVEKEADIDIVAKTIMDMSGLKCICIDVEGEQNGRF